MDLYLGSSFFLRAFAHPFLNPNSEFGIVLVVVLVLENPRSFRNQTKITNELQDVGLFAVTESQCTEDEHDDENDSRQNYATVG